MTAGKAKAAADIDTNQGVRVRVRELRGTGSMEERIDRRPGWAFVWLTVVYALVVACLSHVKLLWLDELITLHIARLGSVSAIWQALERGADPNPPVTHLLVHWSRMVFGDHEWAYRLPAMVGYWVGMLALFAYLRRRLPGTWALGGTVLSMCMAAFDYSFESRSYGIFYGLAMLAFLCWSWTADSGLSRGRRWMTLVGMTAALGAGISTNYFAVLAFVPIAVGEAVREVQGARDQGTEGTRRRRIWGAIHWRIWVGMAVAGTPLLLFRPLIEHAIAQFAPYAWNKVSLGQVSDSYTEMVEIMLWPLLALFAFAIVMAVLARRAAARLSPELRAAVTPRWMLAMMRGRDFPQGLKPGFGEKLYGTAEAVPFQKAANPETEHAGGVLGIPAHEAAGVFCFMAYPFIGYVVASIRGGMLSPRFVIPVCFGFAIAGALTANRLFGGFRRAGVLFLLFVSAWYLCRESCIAYWYEEQKQCFYKVLDKLPEAEAMAPADAPIAIPDPLLALTFHHYAPAAQAAREVFPVDFPAVRFFRGDDSPEENLWAGRGFLYQVPIETLGEFERQRTGSREKGVENSGFLIIAGGGNWLLRDLQLHHYKVRRLPVETRADAIGGFTPLAHGTPEFYAGQWVGEQAAAPIPFRAEDNVPKSRELGLANEGKEGRQ